MDQYILLSEYENTFFIFHEQKVETTKQHLYNVYRAFDHLKLLNDKDSTVLIFNILDNANMDVIAIQHKEASIVRSFDKTNLEEVFNSLKQMDSKRKIFVLNYHFDKEMYETLVIEGSVTITQSMNIANIEYVQYMGQPDEPISNDDLSSPLKLDMPSIAEEDPKAAEETTAAEPKAAEETTAAEPNAAEETTAAEPNAAEETTAEEPKAAEETTAAEPKAAEETKTEEPKAAEETKTEEPKALVEPSTPVVRRSNKFG